jgi:uncharacterized protein YndB with AHSA1/START domain
MTSDNSYTKTLTIAAIPEVVFAALTDPDQVTAWWSAKSTTGPGETGGELQITFGTEERPTVMRVLAAHRPDVVVWEVTSSPLIPDWKGTQPTFTMTTTEDGCRLNFTHHSMVPTLEVLRAVQCRLGPVPGAPGCPRGAARLSRHPVQRGTDRLTAPAPSCRQG